MAQTQTSIELAKLALLLVSVFNFGISDNNNIIGPKNISRAEGEVNVCIPCPFQARYLGLTNPIWKINGTYYDVFNLPMIQKLLPTSFGILITRVDRSMNGTTFQCIEFDNNGPIESSIGMLTVKEVDELYRSKLLSVKEFVPVPQFELEFKNSFEGCFTANNCSLNQSFVDYFEINLTYCNGDLMKTWTGDEIHNISFSEFNMDNCPLFLKIIGYNTQGSISQEVLPYLTISDYSVDLLEYLTVSSSQFCVNLPSTSELYIVLEQDGEFSFRKYCNCFLISGDVIFKLLKCYCYCTGGNRTMALIHLVQNYMSESVVQACFSNYSLNLNNSILHVFESKRYCAYCSSPLYHQSQPYRSYIRLQKILIVLPNPPSVNIDISSSSVYFFSQNSDYILLNDYQVIVTDLVNITIYNDTIPSDLYNNITIPGLLMNCSPYYVVVKAYNMFGFSDSSTKSNETGDVCDCIKKRVVIDFNQTNGNVNVRVQCNEIYSNPDGILTVKGEYNMKILHLQENTVTVNCGSLIFNRSFECGHLFILFVNWSSNNFQCPLKEVNTTLLCSGGVGRDITANNNIIIIVLIVLTIVVLLLP